MMPAEEEMRAYLANYMQRTIPEPSDPQSANQRGADDACADLAKAYAEKLKLRLAAS